jgi:predicted secreted protein
MRAVDRRRLPRLAIAAVVTGAVLVLQACAAMSEQVVRVEEEDSGQAIEMKTGQVLEIVLMSFPGRGLTISLGSVVTPTLVPHGTPTYNDDTIRGGIAGTGSYEAWRFRAAQPGMVTVRMDYRLQWQATGAPTRSVTYDVVVR